MRRTKMVLIGATAALLVLASGAQCEETKSPFQRFAERCLELGPRYDQTVALAKESGWPDLAEDMTMGIQPLGEPASFQGWLVNSDGASPFEAVVVARGTVGPKTVESCTMAFAGTDAAAFERSFASTEAARPSGEQKGTRAGAEVLCDRARGREGSANARPSNLSERRRRGCGERRRRATD